MFLDEIHSVDVELNAIPWMSFPEDSSETLLYKEDTSIQRRHSETLLYKEDAVGRGSR